LNLLYKIVAVCFFTICSVNRLQAQFYVSSPACASDPMQPVTSGTPPQVSCGTPLRFFNTDTSSVTSVWAFGTSTAFAGRSVSFEYTTPGVYPISLSKRDRNGNISIVGKSIVVGRYPLQPKFNNKLDADTTVCLGSKLKLDPYDLLGAPSNVKYLWYPYGDTTRTIEVDSAGCYSVEVIDKTTGCSRSAKINVKLCYKPPNSGSLREKWYFGNGNILEFEASGTKVPRDSLANDGELQDKVQFTDLTFSGSSNRNNSKVNTQGTSTQVYDKLGNLAYYSDGFKLFYGEDDSEILDLNGNVYNVGGFTTSQGLLLSPAPGCNSCDYAKYYLFKVDPKTGILYYDVIDKRYDDQKGRVVSTNNPLIYPVSERLIGGIASDNEAFEIFTDSPKEGKSYLIRLDSMGVNVRTQDIGTLNNLSDGTINISPNQQKLARGVIINSKNYVEIFDIDPQDKSLSNPILIDLNIAAPPKVYGISFSPSSDIVYVSLAGDPALGQTSYFIQLALADGNAAQIAANKIILSTSATETYGEVSIGPVFGEGEKNVYLSIKGKNFVPYVQNPNVKGNATVVNFSLNQPVTKGVDVGGITGQRFTNQIKSPDSNEGDGLSANYSGNCFGSPTILSTQGICSPLKNEAKWIFEDGTTKDGLQTSYTFKKLGWNKIRLEVSTYFDSKVGAASGSNVVNNLLKQFCHKEVYEGTIFIKPAPSINLPNPIYICLDKLEKKKLNPKPEGGSDFKFNWMTSLGTTISNDSVYVVELPATYKLEIENNLGCSNDSTFKVVEGCEPEIIFPEVFTPNFDGINDTFKISALFVENIVDFKIYNRWGEVVFEADKIIDLNWDGKVKNRVYGNQLYPFELKYRSKYFPNRGLITQKGTILLLR
jgi:gliding motility-associated-like protein